MISFCRQVLSKMLVDLNIITGRCRLLRALHLLIPAKSLFNGEVHIDSPNYNNSMLKILLQETRDIDLLSTPAIF